MNECLIFLIPENFNKDEANIVPAHIIYALKTGLDSAIDGLIGQLRAPAVSPPRKESKLPPF
jgi:hypothetical protein